MKYIEDSFSIKSINIIRHIEKSYLEKGDEELIKIIVGSVPERIIDTITTNYYNSIGLVNGMDKGIMCFNDVVNRNIKVDNWVLNYLDKLENILVKRKLLNKKMLQELIILEWIWREEKKTNNFIDNLYDNVYVGYYDKYYNINVEKDIWKNYRKFCKHRKISNNQGFKLAVVSFLDSRKNFFI